MHAGKVEGGTEECQNSAVGVSIEMSAIVVDEYSDELNEGSRRIRRGCTIGRILNLCMAFAFLLVMITALIVSGALGGVNLTVSG